MGKRDNKRRNMDTRIVTINPEHIDTKVIEEAGRILKQLTRENDDYAIIYIEENFAVQIQTEIDKFKDSPTPAIILIPGREGSIGLGQSALRAAVERAVGTNILGD